MNTEISRKGQGAVMTKLHVELLFFLRKMGNKHQSYIGCLGLHSNLEFTKYI